MCWRRLVGLRIMLQGVKGKRKCSIHLRLYAARRRESGAASKAVNLVE